MTGLNDRFNDSLQKAMGSLVGEMTGKMEGQIKELRKTTQKQLDDAEAKVAGMQAALLMARAVIDKALGAAPKNGVPIKHHGGARSGAGRPRGKPKLTDADKEKAVELYRRRPDIPLEKIGKLFGISGSYVYLLAQQRGLVYSRKTLSARNVDRKHAIPPQTSTARKPGDPIDRETDRRIWELHLEGQSSKQIGQAVGVSHWAVRDHVRAHRTTATKRKTKASPAVLARRREAGRRGGLKRAANMRAREAQAQPTTAETSAATSNAAG